MPINPCPNQEQHLQTVACPSVSPDGSAIQARLGEIVAGLPLGEASAVLLVGHDVCGLGQALADQGLAVTGASLDEAPGKYGLYPAVRGSRLEIPADSLDLVVMLEDLSRLMWDRWALQWLSQLIKPGGYLVFYAPVKPPVQSMLERALEKVVSKLGGGLRKLARFTALPVWNERRAAKRYHPATLSKMAQETGYQVESVVRVSGNNPGAILRCRKAGQAEEALRDPTQHCRRFEAHYKQAIAKRDRWLQAHLSQKPVLFDFTEISASAKSALVLSPHPDDELIGCGGSVLKLKAAGTAVTILQLTNGCDTLALKAAPKEVRNTIRLKEAETVAQGLGAGLVTWGLPDQTLLAAEQENVERMRDLLEQQQPQIIFVPFINDVHPDHIAANHLLADALKLSSMDLTQTWVLGYEVWSLVPPNVYCVIDDQFEQKARLLMHYVTPMQVKDYAFYCRELNRYHAIRLLQRQGYVEAFFGLNAAEYIALIDARP